MPRTPPVGPKRVFDTRAGNSPDALRTMPKTKVAADSTIEVRLTDLAGYIPGDGVGAVSLNVTVTNPDASGFITVYPCGARTLVSSLNYVAGQTVANTVIAPGVGYRHRVFLLTGRDRPDRRRQRLADGRVGVSTRSTRHVSSTPGQATAPTRSVFVPKTKIGGTNILEVRVTDLVGRRPGRRRQSQSR